MKVFEKDFSQIQNNPNHEVYFLQTAYREEVDQNVLGTVDWGFYPVFGYMNSFYDSPAMSNNPSSWPSAWPSIGSMTKWPGEWDGRFGRGIQYADLETYFVVNDAQDQEYLQNKWECQSVGSPNSSEIYSVKEDCLNECATYTCQDSGISIYSYETWNCF